MKFFKNIAIWLALIATFVVFMPAFQAEFVQWDDPAYIINNPYITDLSWEGIVKIFKVREFEGNYHPLSLLSHAIDYSIGGLDPFYFHLHSIILHLLNVALVFWFIRLLTNRWEIAFITAILFGIHPMHVESVAWATERKDVLYVFHFLIGLVSYMYYVQKNRLIYYFLALLFLILSALSKGQAVVFPIALVLIDLYRRGLSWKSIFSKTPFFLASLFFGLLAISTQGEGSASSSFENMGGKHKFFVAGYNVCMYTLKSIVPFKLSSFHPYPDIADGWWPWYIYAAAIVALVGFAFVLYRFRKQYWLLFALGFFLVCIIPVSQIIPLGKTIIAERYTYLAYLGLFFGVAYLLVEKLKVFEHKIVPIVTLGCYLVFLSVYAYSRTTVWQESKGLWTDVIEKYPDHFIPYANRAAYYRNIGELRAAVRDFDLCAQRSPDNPACFNSKGLVLRELDQFEEALECFDRALAIDSNYFPTRMNRGMLLNYLDRDEEALVDMNKMVELDPDTNLSFIFRAVVLEKLGRYKEAIKDFSTVIIREPLNAGIYNSRGLVLFKYGDIEAALQDYGMAIYLNPNYPVPYYRRSKVYWSVGKKEEAIADVKKALELGYQVPQSFIDEINQSLQDEAR